MARKRPDGDEETIALDTRGQIAVELDGTQFTLRPSFEAILEAEKQTGLNLYELATLAANSRMSIDQIAIVVAATMRAHGKANPEDPLKSSYVGAKAETLAPMIYEACSSRVMGRVAVLLAGAVMGGYTASGEAKTPGT